jgi:RHS repeat-associated protein
MKRFFITAIATLLFFIIPTLSYSCVAAPPAQDPPEPGPPCLEDGTCCPLPAPGAPEWAVNPINTNLYVTDIPLWYEPAIGPSVRAQVSYNSTSETTGDEIFGSKWIFVYGGSLQNDTSDNVTIVMADGKELEFESDGTGGYTQGCDCDAYFVLEKLSDTHYELRNKSDKKYIYSEPSVAGDKLYLTQVVDAHNNSLTIGYSDNRLTTITDTLGQVTTLHYNSDALVERISDPFGREALFTYDGERNLTSLTDIGGYKTSVEYSAESVISALVNDGGRTEFYIEPATNALSWVQYPAPGAEMGTSSRITITHPDGNKEEYYYNGVNATFWHVAPEDYRDPYEPINNLSAEVPKTTYTYASSVKGVRSKIATKTNPNGETKRYTYDYATGRNLTTADAAGNTSKKTYTEKGQIETRTAPNGRLTRYIYDTDTNDLLSIIDEHGATTMTYDDKHQVTSTTDLSGKTTSYEYNTSGQLSKITDPLGTETLLIYNGDHRLQNISKAGQILSTITYDAMGRQKTSLDATGLLLSYDYDDLNHLTTITYPDAKTESYEYSSSHSPNLATASTDRAGGRSVLDYNGLKELVSSINPEGGVSGYERDSNGNIAAFVDPNHNSTLFDYDATNRLIKRTYADGKSLSYSYNNTGLLQSVTNSRGQKTSYYYDENGNLLTIDYSDWETPDVYYSYDGFDRLTQVEDGAGITRFTYDSASRVETVDGPWEDDTLTYSYDDLGRIVSVELQNGKTRSHMYDELGRLVSITIGTDEFSYEYENGASPLVEKLVRPNGSSTSYSYDSLNRLLEINNSDSQAAVLNKYEYSYNAQDLRDKEIITNTLTTPTPTEGVNVSDYNVVNQLLANSNPDESFVYDEDGNMVEGYTQDGEEFTATYDQENRLTSISFSDSDGIHHLTKYSYGHDSFIVRIEKREDTVLVSDTRIIRNGKLAIQERDADNSVLREYLWGKNLGGGIGGLLQLSQAGSDYAYLYDGKGNVTSLLDSSGAIVASYRYDTFGKVVAQSGSLNQPFQFSTKRFDSDTGLIYYGYRFYNPSIERWMNRDPLGEAGGINLYGFVGNDPVNWIDPDGLSKKDPWYGETDPDFKDWVHDEKQGEGAGRGGSDNYTKDEIRKLKKRWNDEGRPGGKGRKSGRGGKTKGGGNNSKSEMCGEDCQKVATVVVAGGVTYIVYRCVRMAPSLFPPLWWTIPGNAAIP